MTDTHLTRDEVLALSRGREVPAKAQAHADTCSTCGATVLGQARVWEILGHAQEGSPSPEVGWPILRTRLRPHGAPGEKQPKAIPYFSMAAMLILAVGLGGWWQVTTLRERIRALEEANTILVETNTALALSHESVSRRLAAVMELSAREESASGSSELLRVLGSDPDEHVRILALEGLRAWFISGGLQVETLLDVLSGESSPLVQADLVGLLIEISGDGIVPTIREALPPGTLHPFVASQLNQS